MESLHFLLIIEKKIINSNQGEVLALLYSLLASNKYANKKLNLIKEYFGVGLILINITNKFIL